MKPRGHHPKPFRTLLYLLTAIALIAAACGGSDTDDASEGDAVSGDGGEESSSGGASSDEGGSSVPAGIGPTTDLTEGTGGELIIGMTASNIPLLDTGLSQNEGYEGIRFVGNQLYDGLTRFDLSSEEGVPEVVPALAESWEASEDLVTWTFVLREGVTFHDGTPWDADAAVFNLERYTDEDSPNFYPELAAQGGINVGGIDTVSKIDDMTIEITTNGPWSYLPIDLAAVFFGSPTAIQELGNEAFGEAPVGTGPFTFVELVRGERLVLDRNEEYWRGAPALDRVILRPIPDSTARVAALQAGEVDWIEVPLPDDIPGLVENDFQVLLNTYDHIWPWVLDTTKPPFDDVRVRQALNYAINRPSLSDDILQGTAQPANQSVPTANFAYEPSNETYSYDPDLAMELLTEAGYPDGFSFRLSFPTSGSGNMSPIPMNESLQADLAAIGITVELEPIEWAAMLEDFFIGNIPGGAEAINISLSYQQEGFWSLWFGSESALNAGKYSNAEVDALFDQAKQTEMPADRAAIYSEAATYITNDAAWLFVVSDLNPRAVSPEVHNFRMAQSWFVDLTEVWVG